MPSPVPLIFLAFFWFGYRLFFQASAQMPTRGIYSNVTLPYLTLPGPRNHLGTQSEWFKSLALFVPILPPIDKTPISVVLSYRTVFCLLYELDLLTNSSLFSLGPNTYPVIFPAHGVQTFALQPPDSN